MDPCMVAFFNLYPWAFYLEYDGVTVLLSPSMYEKWLEFKAEYEKREAPQGAKTDASA